MGYINIGNNKYNIIIVGSRVEFSMIVNWNEPKYGKKELALVKEVLESGYTSEGPKTRELEEKLAKIVNAKYVIMTTSCTAALYLAIEADKRIRRYEAGDVIVPDLTFVGTKNAIEQANLDLKIGDVHPEDYLLNDMYFDENSRIVLLVTLLGRSGNDQVSSNFNPTPPIVICDNAGCLGSNVPNGKVGCYSLQSNKIISCGQGGFCATDDINYATEIRRLKDFGRIHKEQNDTIGFNFKFNDILAAVALGQLETLELRKTRLVAQYNAYRSCLSDLGKFITYDELEIPLWMEFIVEGHRDKLFDYLHKEGIECRKPWDSISGRGREFPNAQYYRDNVLWLPSGEGLTLKNISHVVRMVKRYFAENGK
jgi:dTDP-4-amino-4,6-dideoxygalactose transaminase